MYAQTLKIFEIRNKFRENKNMNCHFDFTKFTTYCDIEIDFNILMFVVK